MPDKPDRVKKHRQKLVHTIEEDVKEFEKVVEEEAVSGGQRVREATVEFLDFIRQKGVIGLAVGIVIGAAVTLLVNSLVSDVVNPLLGLFLPSADKLTDLTWHFFSAEIRYGAFAATAINFLVIALIIFAAFKWLKLDQFDKKRD